MGGCNCKTTEYYTKVPTVEEIRKSLKKYIELEKEKIDIAQVFAIWKDYPDTEKRREKIKEQQDAIEKEAKAAFGENVKIIRMKNIVYLQIGSVEKW